MPRRVTPLHTRAQVAADRAAQSPLLRRRGLLRLRQSDVDLLQVVRSVRAVRESNGGRVLRRHHRRHQEGASTRDRAFFYQDGRRRRWSWRRRWRCCWWRRNEWRRGGQQRQGPRQLGRRQSALHRPRDQKEHLILSSSLSFFTNRCCFTNAPFSSIQLCFFSSSSPL